MSQSKARLAADWFAKLQVNATTQEIEHTSIPPSGTQKFTANGGITSGEVVILNTDGTISPVTVTPAGIETASFFTNQGVQDVASVYDPTSDKTVIFYRDPSTNYGMAVVATYSNGSMTFGTPVAFTSVAVSSLVAVYSSNVQKIVVSYVDVSVSPTNSYAIVGTVSGTSISFGSATQYKIGNSGSHSMAYDSNYGQVLIAYWDQTPSPNTLSIISGSVSGTSISFGTPVVLDTGYINGLSLTYHPSSVAAVVVYSNRGNDLYGPAHGKAISGYSDPGNAFFFGSPWTFNSGSTAYMTSVYVPSQGKTVAFYLDMSDPGNMTGQAAHITSFSDAVAVTYGYMFTPVGSLPVDIVCSLGGTAGEIVVGYRDLSGNNGHLYSVDTGTLSGNNLTFSLNPFDSGVNISSDFNDASMSFDPDAKKAILSVGASTVNAGGYVVPIVPSSETDVLAWIGIASENIGDGATGQVTILGGVNDQQSGLTVGAVHYVTDDGSFTTDGFQFGSGRSSRRIGKALSSTEMLITDGNVFT